MAWKLDDCDHGLLTGTPAVAGVQSPNKVIMISDWLTKTGGGVNTVMKDQIDYLVHAFGIPVDILVEGGDYEPDAPATFTTFPDPGNPDAIYSLLRLHIMESAIQSQRIAVIIHNILTVPYSRPLNQALRRTIAEVEENPTLAENVKFIAWAHDVFDVPHEMVPGVAYVTISEERQRTLADYFHQRPSRFPVVLNAVNFRRLMALSPEADWLANTFRLYDEDFVAYYPVRLARNKNIEGAIAIVAALNRSGRKTTLLVPGMTDDWQRDYYDQLRELAGALKIPEKVLFLAELTFEGRPFQVTDEVIRDLYKLASFLLFTSHEEGFGLPLIEAASWRLPAVISPIQPLMSIAQAAGSLVVDPDHEAVDQIARRIIDYMDGNSSYRMQRRVFSLFNMAHQFGTMGWGLLLRPHPTRRIGAQTSIYFPRRRIEDQYLDAVHNGLDAFEVFFDPQPAWHLGFNPEDLKDDIRRWLLGRAREQDVHLSVYARRHIPNPDERRHHWKECVTFARAIGSVMLVIDLSPPEAFSVGEFDRFMRDLQQVIDLAEAYHIRIAIENGSYDDAAGARFLTSAERLNDLFARLGRDESTVGVSFNVGRAHLVGDPLAYLRKIHAPIFHVKLFDKQGPGHAELHQRLGEGNVPWECVLGGVPLTLSA
jgi:glycosyltransferase involved in cell wall biosynthesis/sugar phosphate isomerase/epimerase